jgi:hypothetical protein
MRTPRLTLSLLAPLLVASLAPCAAATQPASDAATSAPAMQAPASHAPPMPGATAVPTSHGNATFTQVPAGSELVHVATCSTKNVDPKGGPGGITYIPGQAVSSYWPDVYSNTIYQPSASTGGAQLFITFTNISHKPMKTIEFGVLKNQLLAGEARDDGDFAPNATVKHRLGLQVSAMLPGDTRCVPLQVWWTDGTKWRNPRLPKRGKAYFNSKIPPKPYNQ